MSLSMKLADRALHLQRKVLADLETSRAIGAAPRTAAPTPRSLRRRWRLSHRQLLGRDVVTLTPKTAARPVTVVYLHGGAYVNALSRPHWWIIDHMARGTGARVVAPLYGLAPEHTVDEAFEFLEAVLRDIRRTRPGDRIYLAGDSAGAGLSLAVTMEHRRDELRPAGLFLFSPWVDTTMDNPRARAMEPVDAMLGVDGLRYWGEQWAGTRPVSDPRVSPGLGDVADLPPTWVYQGGRDLFLPDVEAFAARARRAGSPVTLRVSPDGFHVFVGLTFAPESRIAYREIRTVLRREISAPAGDA